MSEHQLIAALRRDIPLRHDGPVMRNSVRFTIHTLRLRRERQAL